MKTTHHLFLRFYMLEKKFRPRYDVTIPLVLTRNRQDVSAGKCVAGMTSPPRQHTSCSHKVISASAAIANLRHRARMSWILEHPSESWLWGRAENTDPCGAASHGLGADGLVFLDHCAGSELCFWLGTWTTEICTVLLASVLQRVDAAVCPGKNMFIQRLPHHAQRFILHVTTPALSFSLSRLP